MRTIPPRYILQAIRTNPLTIGPLTGSPNVNRSFLCRLTTNQFGLEGSPLGELTSSRTNCLLSVLAVSPYSKPPHSDLGSFICVPMKQVLRYGSPRAHL